MKVKTLDQIESMHQWLDDAAVLRSATVKFEAGAVLDSETLGVHVVNNDGDIVAVMPEDEHVKWFARLVKTSHASEDLDAPLNDHPANAVQAERVTPREDGAA
jgi:hypothetical protein